MTVFEFIEDFDNAELDESDRIERLEAAVMDYNAEYGATNDPQETVAQYERLKYKHDE